MPQRQLYCRFGRMRMRVGPFPESGWGRDLLSFSEIPRPVCNFDWRSEMKIKSLLYGSAAALVAATGAKAADAIVIAEPEPVEYVRVCDAYGAGFFYIPGTETCMRIGGEIRFQAGATNDRDPYGPVIEDQRIWGEPVPLWSSVWRRYVIDDNGGSDTPNYHGYTHGT